MLDATTTQWDDIDQWSPTLFLVGGILLAGHAIVQGVAVYTEMPVPPDVFVTTGHLIGLLGLVGLGPVLLDRTPTLTRVATMLAVIPLIGWTGLTVAKLITVLGSVTSMAAVVPGTLILLVVTTTILTYGLYGIAALRTDDKSPLVGLLVLAPGTLIVVLLAAAIAGGLPAGGGVLIGVGLSLSMLALGYRLRTWDQRVTHLPPAGDPNTG